MNTTTKKLNIGVLCGGKSSEHEISLLSGQSVLENIDHNKYTVIAIAIDKEGKWFAEKNPTLLLEGNDPKSIKIKASNNRVVLVPHGKGRLAGIDGSQIDLVLDVVFSLLHGQGGENGEMQGLLELAEVPFVGAGVLGSSVGMDKDVMKRLLRDANVPIGKFLVFAEGDEVNYDAVVQELDLPVFIKPANAGSSIGISKAKNQQEFLQGILEALKYDSKVIVEEFINGREIECAVLGNERPTASLPGEIIAHHEFYSYAAKYLDANGATLEVSANLPSSTVAEVQRLALKVFKVLECSGMARVDFFVRDDGKVYVNEINTIPGFTAISMYPKMWAAQGISYPELIERLIKLAFERFLQKRRLKIFL